MLDKSLSEIVSKYNHNGIRHIKIRGINFLYIANRHGFRKKDTSKLR
jgi:hypothetical protein